MKSLNHSEVPEFESNLAAITYELKSLLKNVKSKKHKKGIALVQKKVEQLYLELVY